MRIRITVDSRSLEAELEDNQTAEAVAAILPIEASASVWGDEIYFEIPVILQEAAGARADVEVGTLAYWPPGRAMCIFYGRTPASVDDTPRAYSAVNVFGRVIGDATVLRGVSNGASVLVEKA
jgi:uncharacterized protein